MKINEQQFATPTGISNQQNQETVYLLQTHFRSGGEVIINELDSTTMNVKELKELVKTYFNLTEKAAVNAKFAEATLEDGTTKIYWDGDLGVGTRVFLLDAEGNQIPAPEGSHTTEDGTNVILGAEGEVLEINKPATAEDMMEVGEDIKSTGVPIAHAVHDKMEEMPVEDLVKAIVEGVNEMMGSYRDRMSAIEAKLETFSKAPASSKTLPASAKKSIHSKPTVEPLQKERFERAIANLSKNKK